MTKMVGNGYVNTENSQMALISAIFSSTYSKKAVKSMANLTSQSCSDLQLVVCLSKGDRTM